MSMTLKDILGAVMGEQGFLVPTSFVGSTSPDDLQMVYLANRATSFIREQQFQRCLRRSTTTLTASQTYPLPSDYLEIIPDTMRIVGRVDKVNFPCTPEFWSYLLSQSGPVGIPVNVRIIANELNVYSPTVGDVLAFEYVSNAPVTSSANVPQQRFLADNDVWLMDDDLLILETRWRWLQVKGLPDWEAVFGECKNHRNAVRGRDRGAQIITGTPLVYGNEPYTNLWVP
jgi:hypothetical protein